MEWYRDEEWVVPLAVFPHEDGELVLSSKRIWFRHAILEASCPEGDPYAQELVITNSVVDEAGRIHQRFTRISSSSVWQSIQGKSVYPDLGAWGNEENDEGRVKTLVSTRFVSDSSEAIVFVCWPECANSEAVFPVVHFDCHSSGEFDILAVKSTRGWESLVVRLKTYPSIETQHGDISAFDCLHFDFDRRFLWRSAFGFSDQRVLNEAPANVSSIPMPIRFFQTNDTDQPQPGVRLRSAPRG